jgi:hypothetical protein
LKQLIAHDIVERCRESIAGGTPNLDIAQKKNGWDWGRRRRSPLVSSCVPPVIEVLKMGDSGRVQWVSRGKMKREAEALEVGSNHSERRIVFAEL